MGEETKSWEDVQSEEVNLLHFMDSDELLSRMTIADRENNIGVYRLYRSEVLYRLRCAQPLLNWVKPSRL